MLHPFEPVTPLHVDAEPGHQVPLATWRVQHLACLLDQVFGPDALVATQPGRLTIEPYQLVPLMRALELPRPRLLLADDVGLGKTVQAGLIVTELIARRQAHRVLVIAPAGPLLLQWQQELRQRFGLRFTVIADSAGLEAQRRAMELGGNPFEHDALTLVGAGFRQAGTRAAGAGTCVLGHRDHRRGASLHQCRPRFRPRRHAAPPSGGSGGAAAATRCCC